MPVLDGKEITKMQQMIDAFRKDPDLGRTTLRLDARWDGKLETHHTPSPKIQGSGGECLYAEELLEVLAKCVLFDVLAHADHEGVPVGAVDIGVEGDIDFAGSVGLDAPAAFTALRLDIAVGTDVSENALSKLREKVRRCSIVGQSLAAVPQEFNVTRREEVAS